MPSENEYTNPWASVEVLSYQGTSDVIDAICDGFFVGTAQGGASVLTGLVGIIYAQDDRKSLYFPNLQNAPDLTPARPVVTIVSPTPGGPIGPTEKFIFEVTCSEPIVSERFNLRTGGPGSRWEVNFRDGEASPGSVVERTEIEGGLHFEVRRTGSWAGTQIDFEPVFGTAVAVAATNE